MGRFRGLTPVTASLQQRVSGMGAFMDWILIHLQMYA